MTMTTVEATRTVTGGVDTHLEAHVAAALDPLGGFLGTKSFATTPGGYAALLSWLEGFGEIGRIGIEGTGSMAPGSLGSATLRTPSANMAVVDLARLLDDLCVDLGFCLPPRERERLLTSPPATVDAFTDAVFVAEGMNPELADRHLWRQVRSRVAKTFARASSR
jgi:hypothetical protein